MAHSKFIVIKCPACQNKFEAEREEESSFISCPDCAMQVKISGTHDRKRRTPRHMTPAPSLPSKRYQERVQFSDLAGGAPVSREAARKRLREREANEELIIDEDEEPAADKPPVTDGPSSGKELPRRGIERRAAKLEERAAKLEERAAKLAKQLQTEREAAAKAKKQASTEASPKTAAEAKKQTSTEASPKTAAKDTASGRSGTPASSAAAAASREDASRPSKEPDEASAQEDLGFEKVEVRSTGERRRLHQAPKAEVPKPRSRRHAAASYVDDLRAEKEEAAVDKKVNPKQGFDDRKITEGSRWRRHLPNRGDDPEWESVEEEKKEFLYPYQRRRRIFIWTVTGLLGLFLIVAGYHFMLGQIGWMKPVVKGETTPEVPPAPKESWTKADMLESAAPVIKAFLASNSNEEALQYVRRAGKVAGFMKKHYLPGNFEPVEFKSLGALEECEVVYENFFRVPVNFTADRPRREIYLEIPGSSSDEWLVDWESWEGYSEMGFNEMRIRQPKYPVLIRCFMLHEVYYGAAFPKADDHRSFKLLDHNRENQLWGYIDTLSDSYRTVASELASRNTLMYVKATLRVRFPEQSSMGGSDQVEITEFITFGWVLTQ